jgi:membrane protein involved in colicin uptake
MLYESKSRRSSRLNKARAITITIIIHFLLLFGILTFGEQEIPEALKAIWKADTTEQVVKP